MSKFAVTENLKSYDAVKQLIAEMRVTRASPKHAFQTSSKWIDNEELCYLHCDESGVYESLDFPAASRKFPGGLVPSFIDFENKF